MMDTEYMKKKNPAAGNGGDNKFSCNKLTKPIHFPQESLYWRVRKECAKRTKNDPSIYNQIIERCVAEKCRQVQAEEVFNHE